MKDGKKNPHPPMPVGTVFSGSGNLHEIRKDLINIAVFLQDHLMSDSAKLQRYEDWWEHDGLHFPKGKTDIHGLFGELESSRKLLESMSDQFNVFSGLGPKNNSWYLRYFAEWDDDDDKLIAVFAIAFVEPLAARFRKKAVPKLNCFDEEQSSDQYIKSICFGEISLLE